VFYDAATGQFRRITVDDRTGMEVEALMIEPGDPQFTGPVAILVNPRSISSAEGLAHCVRDREDGAVVGFHGTRGSFGLAGGEIALPGGIVLHYPDGYAVDAAGRVLIDSRNGVGGVAPTVRVPMTEETVLAYARGVDVELEAAVRWLDARNRAGSGAAKP
jgi:carboxyl-terminal processing protease